MKQAYQAFFALLGVILIGTTSPTIATAGDSSTGGAYIVGGIGLTDFNVSNQDLQSINTALVNLGFSSSTSSTDNSGLYLKGHGGYHLNKYLAVEGGFTSLGQLEINTTLTGPSESLTTTADVYGFEASGLAKLETGDSAFAYLRLGFLSWDADLTVTSSLGSTTAFESGTDPTVGIGWQYGKQHGIRVEYQYYPVDNSDIQTLHLSGVYGF